MNGWGGVGWGCRLGVVVCMCVCVRLWCVCVFVCVCVRVECEVIGGVTKKYFRDLCRGI